MDGTFTLQEILTAIEGLKNITKILDIDMSNAELLDIMKDYFLERIKNNMN